jgi:hypothetical protein
MGTHEEVGDLRNGSCVTLLFWKAVGRSSRTASCLWVMGWLLDVVSTFLSLIFLWGQTNYLRPFMTVSSVVLYDSKRHGTREIVLIELWAF